MTIARDRLSIIALIGICTLVIASLILARIPNISSDEDTHGDRPYQFTESDHAQLALTGFLRSLDNGSSRDVFNVLSKDDAYMGSNLRISYYG